MSNHVTAVLLAALLVTTTNCSTPEIPRTGARPIDTRGGDAESDLLSTDAQIALAQPGATSVNSSVRNEDRVQSTNAAPSFTLALTGDVNQAAQSFLKDDPVAKSFADELAMWTERMKAAPDAVSTEAAQKGLNAARAGLVAHFKETIAAMAATAPNLEGLQSLVYAPIYIQSAGETVQKLDADAAKVAAEALVKVVEAGMAVAK